ncbi:hypothetical protein EVAR_56911_1 [Eumeta japonica]|uniref:Reverse transcriptase domain-containing protein n=1 Tax=Eumeta variegata TaxID=151549 RepID=A0A4C1YGG9_EUMVA|nr:hypothetical protein EVAR_56911_1 [Eumeta japonica]
MGELSVKCLLYTEDRIILAPSACESQAMIATKINNSTNNITLEKNGYRRRKILIESMQWRCDPCVVGVRRLYRNIDITALLIREKQNETLAKLAFGPASRAGRRLRRPCSAEVIDQFIRTDGRAVILERVSYRQPKL